MFQPREIIKALQKQGNNEEIIKFIKTKTDPFNGNKCNYKKCLPNDNENNKISCRRNCICYSITCIPCLKAGRSGDMASTYYGESGKNMHCRAKEHDSKSHRRKNTYKTNLLSISILKIHMEEGITLKHFRLLGNLYSKKL